MTDRIPVVVILGPTAVGKTDVSLRLAPALDGEIVSADSRLLYRGMDVGTSKPTPEQRRLVPHHLIDVAAPRHPWSMARFRREALRVVADIHRRGRLPFVVGGTGQYLTALLEGWEPPPRAVDASLRRELESFAAEHGAEALHRRLVEVDPERAAQIDPRNVRRVVRALEIYRLTGEPPSRIRRRHPPPWDVLRLGLSLPRAELYSRIDARVEAMLQSGLIEEVRRLLQAGVPIDSGPMSAIGYRQIAAYLQGDQSLEEALTAIRRATRILVRRQANWFRRDAQGIHWFESRPGVEAAMERVIRSWLEGRRSTRPA